MDRNKAISKTIRINARAIRVWELLTDPLQIKVWLADSTVEVISEWKKGSPIIFEGKLHGYDYHAHGEILEFIPGELLRYNSWNRIEELPDEPGNYSIVEFRLEAKECDTELKFHHSNLKAKAQYEHSNLYWNVTLGIIKEMAEKAG